MKPSEVQTFGRRFRGEAMALVVTLALLVLVTVLVFAFFTVTTANRALQASRASQIKAELLAQTASEYVTGRFLTEMIEQSTVVSLGGGTHTVFLPATRADLVPRKRVSPAISNSADFPTLVRQSVGVGDTNASAHSSLEPARNSRMISAQRWNSPRLALGAGFPSNGVPAWIYVSPGEGPGAVPGPDVVGRFAYNVYATGGLLDVNAAGHPETLFAGTARPKDTLAGAALRQLGVSVGAIVRMTQFRSPADTGNREAYLSNARAFAVDGYRDTVATVSHHGTERSYTNNFFFDRQDFIRYARSLGNDTSLTEALPYLTTFSRARTGPTWEPTRNASEFPGYFAAAQAVTSHPYRDNAGGTNAVNPRLLTRSFDQNVSIIHYRDDGRIEREDVGLPYSYTVGPGTPVVHRKFSLAKLAWLGPNEPEATAFHLSLSNAEREKAIFDCFGLRWEEGGTFPKWVYNHGAPDRILTLDEVAAAGREPDFFELLKAVILEGSLGKHPGAGSGPDSGSGLEPVAGVKFDRVFGQADGQVLQIGANIIDQADSDGYPTAISSGIPLKTFTEASDPPDLYDPALLELYGTVLGIENIPYILRVWNPVLSLRPDEEAARVRGWWWPELWNPHRRPVSPRVLDFRIRAYGIATTRVQFNPNDGEYGDPANSNSPEIHYDTDARNFVEFRDTGRFYDQSAPLSVDLDDFAGSTTDGMNKWNASDYNSDSRQILGIFAGEVTRPESLKDTVARLHEDYGFVYYDPRTLVSPDGPMTLVMEVRDEQNRWRPASMMARFNKLRRNSVLAADTDGVRAGFHRSLVRGLVGKLDPRTERFASSTSEDDKWKMGGQLWRNAGAVATSGFGFFGPAAAGGFTLDAGHDERYEFGDLVRNQNSLKNFYSDPDGVVRPGDGVRTPANSDDGNPLLFGAGTGSQPRRPVVLDRPFQSVGELGGVFRDSPYRTLDFWSGNSADSGLLDVFAVRDELMVTGGKINPNLAPEVILGALLRDASKHATAPLSGPNSVPVTTQAEANAVAGPLAARLKTAPLANVSEFVTEVGEDMIPLSLQAVRVNKTLAEFPVRALGDVANFRTWTFLIDVVAQAGRFSGTGTVARDFVVEGEKRAWVHVAMDRFTGEVLGVQTESVYE